MSMCFVNSDSVVMVDNNCLPQSKFIQDLKMTLGLTSKRLIFFAKQKFDFDETSRGLREIVLQMTDCQKVFPFEHQ